MLEKIVELAVQRRGVVLVIWAAIFGAALVSIPKLSIDAVPDVTNMQVTVMTSAPGLSPVEVEQYLTFPIETAMNGLPGSPRSAPSAAPPSPRSPSSSGRDGHLVRAPAGLRAAEAGRGRHSGRYGRPELAPVSTGLGEIYEFYLDVDEHSPMELRTLLDWVVAYKLRAVPGVIEVNGMGGEAKQYQVVLDPKRLAGYRMSVGDSPRRPRAEQCHVGGGYIEKNQRVIRHPRRGAVSRVEDIENTVVTADKDGTPVLLKHLGQVQIGPALRFGVVTKHGKGEIVAGTVMMLIGRELARGRRWREGKLADIQARAAGRRRDPLLLRPRRVHRSDAEDRLRSTSPRARCWSSGPVPDAR